MSGTEVPFLLVEDEMVTHIEKDLRFFSQRNEVEGGGTLYVTTR